MTLETDTLFLDRIKNIAFYKTPGKIIDNSNILISNEGTYYIDKKKYTRYRYDYRLTTYKLG